MTIGKRPVPPNIHLHEAGPSRWSFARGWSFQMIICERPVPPGDHLQEVGRSGRSFARDRSIRMTIWRGRSLWMIMCNRPVHPNDYLHEAVHLNDLSRVWSLQMIICNGPVPSRWSFATTTITNNNIKNRDDILCLLVKKNDCHEKSGGHPINVIQSFRRRFQNIWRERQKGRKSRSKEREDNSIQCQWQGQGDRQGWPGVTGQKEEDKGGGEEGGEEGK